VIGFGGRVIDDGEPKYLNSPETPVFVKGRELYGLFEARAALREAGYVLVVEGYMDVVALAQAGLGHAVATLGTACTAEHVAKLFRFTDQVVFSFDGDAAGRRAAARALEAALPHASDRRSIRFLFLPPEHDPDSFVRELGAEAFARAVADAVPLSRQLLEHAAVDCDLATAEGRARMLAQAKPLWEALPDEALRAQLLIELAERSRMTAPDLLRLWGRAATTRRRPAPVAAPPTPRVSPLARIRSPQDNIVAALLSDSTLWDALPASDREQLLALPSWHGEAVRWLDRQLTHHGPQAWPALRTDLADPACEAWAERARALIDNAVVPLVTTVDALQTALHQLTRSLQGEATGGVLQAVMQRPNRA